MKFGELGDGMPPMGIQFWAVLRLVLGSSTDGQMRAARIGSPAGLPNSASSLARQSIKQVVLLLALEEAQVVLLSSTCSASNNSMAIAVSIGQSYDADGLSAIALQEQSTV
jgi:hypothetical protein